MTKLTDEGFVEKLRAAQPAPLDERYRALVEAAKALVDWYDGPPYVYVEGEMEERIFAIKDALATSEDTDD